VAQLNAYVTSNDSIGYLQLASNWLSTGVYRFDEGGASAFRMPGYPLVLGVTYLPVGGPLLTQLVQIAASLLVVAMVWHIVLHLGGNYWFAAFGALYYAVYPLVLLSAVIIYPESLSVLAVTAMVLLLVRKRVGFESVVFGLLGGSATYLKPSLQLTAIALMALYLGFCCIRIRPMGRAVAFGALPFLIFLLMLLPWGVRNSLQLGSPEIFSTSTGTNLYGGNNSLAAGGFASDLPFVLPDYSEVESNREFTARAIAWVQSHPTEFMLLLPQKAVRLFHPLALGTSGMFSLPGPLQWLLILIAVVLYALALIGVAVRLLRRDFWAVLVLIVPTATVLVSSLISFGSSRFLLPALPVIAVSAALGSAALVMYGRRFVSEL
jgi:hypothetical protein